jgi:hypothetical protein
LLKVIEDPSETTVGGVPQLIAFSPAGIEIIGVIKGRERYLFGRILDATGPKTKVRYISYDGHAL